MTETMRSALDPAMTVNEIVLADPSAVSVLSSFGIDACCGGSLSLTEAARRHRVSIDVLLLALAARRTAAAAAASCSSVRRPA